MNQHVIPQLKSEISDLILLKLLLVIPSKTYPWFHFISSSMSVSIILTHSHHKIFFKSRTRVTQLDQHDNDDEEWEDRRTVLLLTGCICLNKVNGCVHMGITGEWKSEYICSSVRTGIIILKHPECFKAALCNRAGFLLQWENRCLDREREGEKHTTLTTLLTLNHATTKMCV